MTADQTDGTQVPAKLTPMEAMRSTLVRLEAEFANALPPQIPVQKFIRTTVTAVQMNPSLLEADRRSVLAACMKAAQDGLLIDGREAAIVCYGKNAQYMPMIGGLLKKLRNSGELASIAAHVAYANDEFLFELGDEERVVHRPTLNDRGEPIAAYAIARTKDGAIYREVMSLAQIEQVRAVSKAKNNGPWVQWWDEMARKTVLRRLLKRLPSSADIDAVIEADNDHFDLQQQTSPTTTTPAPLSRLKATLGVETNPAEDPEGDAEAAAVAETDAPDEHATDEGNARPVKGFNMVEEAVQAICDATSMLSLQVVGHKIAASGFKGSDAEMARQAYAERRTEIQGPA